MKTQKKKNTKEPFWWQVYVKHILLLLKLKRQNKVLQTQLWSQHEEGRNSCPLFTAAVTQHQHLTCCRCSEESEPLWAPTYLDLCLLLLSRLGFPSASALKKVPAMQEPQEVQVWSLGLEGPLEESMETNLSILAWRIPWTVEPIGLQSIGLQESDTTEAT